MKFVIIIFTYITQQAFWLTKFFDEVRLPTITPVVIYMDNNYFISNSLNNKNHQYTVVATTRHSRTNDLTTSKALQWAIK